MLGYNGFVALVNLSTKSFEKIVLTEEVAKKYIGGSGLGTYYLMKYSTPDVEPLGADNPLIYMTGPYSATGVPTSGRHHIITKSPATGIYCESDAGGTFGIKLKKTGFDGLIILGKAATPTYLSINEDKIEFKDAGYLWGLDTFETEKILSEENANSVAVSCIGQAGEKLVLISGISHDGIASRIAARGGIGAVMGSKNLKAIVVKGSKKIDVYDKDMLFGLIKEKAEKLGQAGAGMTNFGTGGGMENAEKFGDLPIKNWKQGSWVEETKEITGAKMRETILEKEYGCGACPIHCGRIVKFDDVHGSGPEYETLALLGSSCMINDLKVIARAADLCNRFGIDTISAGGAVAFAMELFEEGIISEKDAGRSIHWGDSEALLGLIKEMGLNIGFGKILGQGVKIAAEQIGKGAEKYAMHVKGLELPGHDPRCFKGLAVGYATSPRGACHLSSFTYPWERSCSMPEFGLDGPHDRTTDVGKGILTAKFQDVMAMADSLKICKFAFSSGAVRIETAIDFLYAITGWKFTFEEFLETGERIFTLKRIYNHALGLDRTQDTLPERILKEPRGTGGSAETLPDLEAQLDEFYQYRGWTKEGVPSSEKIHKLGLEGF
ncbi:MAG: aldehyde ferredoxin oxidoreductase family protein [Clostridia bacterium]